MKDIFISYARQDTEIVDRLTARLKDEDYEVSIDRESIRGGEMWLKRLAHEIENAGAVILVLSTKSVSSVNVQREIYFACEVGKKIFPITLEPVTTPRELKLLLNPIQWIDFATDFENGFRQLVESLSHIEGFETGTSVQTLSEAVETLRAEVFSLPANQQIQEQLKKIEDDRGLSEDDRKFLLNVTTGSHLSQLKSYLLQEQFKIAEKSLDYISDSELQNLERRREAIKGELEKLEQQRARNKQKGDAIRNESIEKTRRFIQGERD